MSSNEEEKLIYLKCVSAGKKLHVRVISPGYNHEANCQFPRNIRQEGKTYSAPLCNLSFSQMRGKFFYRVSKNNIKIIEDNSKIINSVESKECKISIKQIYENVDADCIICMDNKYEVVLVPCGHYCLCKECANQLQKSKSNCPLCRQKINMFVTRDMLQL
jgi:hypothetical protein